MPETPTSSKQHAPCHTLRRVTVAEEQIAEVPMLYGFNDNLAAQLTQVRNRPPGLLTQIHPSLERVLGPRLAHPP